MSFSGISPASFQTPGMKQYDGGNGPGTRSGDTLAQKLAKDRDNFAVLDQNVAAILGTLQSSPITYDTRSDFNIARSGDGPIPDGQSVIIIEDETNGGSLVLGSALDVENDAASTRPFSAISISLSALEDASVATVEDLRQEVAELRAATLADQAIDPTTLTEKSGQNRIFEGQVYYFNGSGYALVQAAAQIDPAFNQSWVYSNGINYRRNSSGDWEAVDTSAAPSPGIPPSTPSVTASRSSEQVTYNVTPDANTGSSALDTILLIYTPAGAPDPVEIDTGLSAVGTYTLTGLQDGEEPAPTFVAVNTQDLRSLPTDPVLAPAQDVPPPYVLSDDDWAAGEEQIIVNLEDQQPTGGLPITDFVWELKEIAQ